MRNIMTNYTTQNTPNGHYLDLLMRLAIKYEQIESVRYLAEILLFNRDMNIAVGKLATPEFFNKLMEAHYFENYPNPRAYLFLEIKKIYKNTLIAEFTPRWEADGGGNPYPPNYNLRNYMREHYSQEVLE